MNVRLQVGDTHNFAEDSLVQVKLRNSIDPMYGALQTDVLEATIYSDAPAENFALNEQKVRLYRDDKKIATYSVKKNVRRGSRRFDLTCRTNLEFLEGEFLGGFYKNETPEAMLCVILNDYFCELDPVIANRYLTGYIPICTRAQALRMVAFALGAVVSVDKEGVFRFQALDPKRCTSIPHERILWDTTLTSKPQYTRVEVVAHDFVEDSDWEVLYNNKDLDNETITLKFQDPVCEYYISDGEILEQGPNYAVIWTTGNMTIKVRRYRHKTAYHTRTNEDAAGATYYSQVLSLRENTLITSENVEEVLGWLFDRAKMRQELTCKILVDQEKPGQLVSLPTGWGSRFTGYITRMDSIMTAQGQVAEVTILGAEEKEETK